MPAEAVPLPDAKGKDKDKHKGNDKDTYSITKSDKSKVVVTEKPPQVSEGRNTIASPSRPSLVRIEDVDETTYQSSDAGNNHQSDQLDYSSEVSEGSLRSGSIVSSGHPSESGDALNVHAEEKDGYDSDLTKSQADTKNLNAKVDFKKI